jgi:hypothetical protein
MVKTIELMQDSTFAQYEKRYNEIALKWLAGAMPDSAATADLRQMAQTCLPDGGRAVLWARGFCATWLKEYYAESGCLESLGARSSDGAAPPMAEPGTRMRIVPNPAHDVVRIFLQSGAPDGRQVRIFDAYGRQVYGGTLPPNGELSIPVWGWQNGLYFAKVLEGAESFSQAFIVQHP